MTDSATAGEQGPPRLLVSLATYNEVENLRTLVAEIREQACFVVCSKTLSPHHLR